MRARGFYPQKEGEVFTRNESGRFFFTRDERRRFLPAKRETEVFIRDESGRFLPAMRAGGFYPE